MASINELQEDLNFVAASVRRGRYPYQPAPGVLLLWALLIPIGFGLADFAPQWCGWFWLVVSPVGGVASVYIGQRSSMRVGMHDTELGWRHAKHWLTMLAVYVLFGATLATGHMDVRSTVPIWLLLTALAYTMAGIHLGQSRSFLHAGIVMFAGYAAMVWLPLPYVWTATGLIISLSFIVAALRTPPST
jgi:hypothetical protein